MLSVDGNYYYDYSGCSVSINSDGTVIAIGAYGANDNGSVGVYQLLNNVWARMGSISNYNFYFESSKKRVLKTYRECFFFFKLLENQEVTIVVGVFH